jgi:hypothetical protein
MSRYPMYKGKETCTRCHRPVEQEKAVWLELNTDSGLYEEPGTVPPEDSQGGFAFGPDCAEVVRKDRAGWKFIGLAKRNIGP